MTNNQFKQLAQLKVIQMISIIAWLSKEWYFNPNPTLEGSFYSSRFNKAIRS